MTLPKIGERWKYQDGSYGYIGSIINNTEYNYYSILVEKDISCGISAGYYSRYIGGALAPPIYAFNEENPHWKLLLGQEKI